MKKKSKIDWKLLILFLVIVYIAAIMGSLLMYGKTEGTWYNFVKPQVTPPNWVFAVVWSILFFLIGLSLYFSWVSAKNKKTKIKLEIVFGVNLVLNVLWSFFFFTLRKPSYAFFELILLWISTLVLILVTYRINRKSGLLLTPYLLWLTFAGIINFLTAFY